MKTKTPCKTCSPIPNIDSWIAVHTNDRPEGFPQEPHREYWQWIAKRIRPITVIPISNHPRRYEIEAAVEVIQPEFKLCYRNALRIAGLVSGTQVIQGFACAGMTVEHGWNYLDGLHFDATGEMVRSKYGKGYTEYGEVFSGTYLPDLPTLFDRWRDHIGG